MSPEEGPGAPLEFTSAPISSWERLYRFLEPEQIPWNAGRPDRDLVRLVEAGSIPPGPALDAGAGAGHDAAYLAGKGFAVTAVDISPAAIALARTTAASAGVEDRIDFKIADLLKAPPADAAFTLLNDRGFFHYLKDPERGAYIALARRALKPAALMLLRVYSDKEPPGLGSLRYAEPELRSLFGRGFEFLEVKEGAFEGPAKAKSLACLLKAA